MIDYAQLWSKYKTNNIFARSQVPIRTADDEWPWYKLRDSRRLMFVDFILVEVRRVVKSSSKRRRCVRRRTRVYFTWFKCDKLRDVSQPSFDAQKDDFAYRQRRGRRWRRRRRTQHRLRVGLAGEQKFNTDLEKILNSRVESLYTVSHKTSSFLFFE